MSDKSIKRQLGVYLESHWVTLCIMCFQGAELFLLVLISVVLVTEVSRLESAMAPALDLPWGISSL